jgi:3-phenylpropionate/cinnamic acid dioxygenase small subunit
MSDEPTETTMHDQPCSIEDEAAVRRFVLREAQLLDARAFDAWLELVADDFVYYVPVGYDDADPNRQVSIAYDDRQRIGERVWRLQSGFAPSQLPPSRTQHVLSDVLVTAAPGSDDLIATAGFLLAEVRNDVQNLYVGRVEYRLRRTPDGASPFLLVRKTVRLVNSDAAHGDLSFVL